MSRTVNLGRVLMSFKGEYNATTTYDNLDIVSYQGSSYIALSETTGNLPTNTTYWGKIAEKGEKGDSGDTGQRGETGETGETGLRGEQGSPGFVFTPQINANGDLSWTNNGNLTNPTMVNVRGPKGDTGDMGPAGQDGDHVHTNMEILNGTQESFTTTLKNKLDGLTNYTLPTATSSTLGGVKAGSNITIDVDGTINAEISGEGSETSDYSNLSNKPQIAGITLQGNKTLADLGIEEVYTTTEKAKLSGIEADANNYTHPTTSGNKHVPSGGSSGQVLKYSADGTAEWGTDNDTTYSEVTASENGLMTPTQKSKLDGIETGSNNYVHPTTPGNKHVPSGGSSGQVLMYSSSGTATWGSLSSSGALGTTNLNSMTTDGIYIQSTESNMTTERNYPDAGLYTGTAILEVKTAGSYILHKFYHTSSMTYEGTTTYVMSPYIRYSTNSGSSWSAWHSGMSF